MPLTPRPELPVWYWPDRQVKPEQFWNEFERTQMAYFRRQLQDWDDEAARERGELPPRPQAPDAPAPSPRPAEVDYGKL